MLPANQHVSIPERVLEALKHQWAVVGIRDRGVSIPERVLEALKLIFAGVPSCKRFGFNP